MHPKVFYAGCSFCATLPISGLRNRLRMCWLAYRGLIKFDRGLSRLIHTELHWLDVPERVVYKLGVMAFNCLHGQAPPYLVELCQPVAGVASRQHLRSATRQLLVVPRHQLSFYGRQACCVAGPSVWNSLPDSLRNPVIGRNNFKSLKTFLFVT